MAFSVACPSCSTKLKSAQAIPLGRMLQCPICTEKFAVTADNSVEAPDDPGDALNPKRRRDAEEDRPRQRRLEYDNQAPRSRPRRDDDEDDRPRQRRRDDDNEAPRSRPRRDDDDDWAPRKKKKQAGLGLKVGVGIGALLAVGAVVFLVVWLRSGSKSGGGSGGDESGGGSDDTEMLALMPADTTGLQFANIDKIMAANPKAKMFNDPKDSLPFILNAAGLKVDDVKAVIEGKNEKDESIEATRLKKPVDKAKLTAGSAEQKVGDKAYWKLKGHAAGAIFISFPSDDLVVWARKEETLKNVLTRGLGNVVLSAELRELMKKVNDGQYWQAVTAKAPKTGAKSKGAQINGVAVSTINRFALQTVFNGTKQTWKTYVVLANNEEAAKVVKELEKNIDKLKEDIASPAKKVKNDKTTDAQWNEFKNAVSNFRISVNGAILERSVTVDFGLFDDDKPFVPAESLLIMVISGCEPL
jgi:hypothetical protein